MVYNQRRGRIEHSRDGKAGGDAKNASSALEGDYLKVIRSVRLSVVAFGFKGSFVVFLSS